MPDDLPPEPLLPPVAAGDVEILDRRDLHRGFFTFEAWTLRHRRHAGGPSAPLEREVLLSGPAAVVLPWDPVRDRVLVIAQLRMAPLAMGDPQPWLLEPIAGRIDPGETPAQAMVREAREEAGLDLDPARLVAGPSHYPSPGALAEYLHLAVAVTDLPDGCAGLGGLASEAEDIRAHLLPRADLVARAVAGRLPNGPLALLALWLDREADVIAGRVAAPGAGG